MGVRRWAFTTAANDVDEVCRNPLAARYRIDISVTGASASFDIEAVAVTLATDGI